MLSPGKLSSGARVRSQTILLGGSWVVISGVISRVTMHITHIRGLIALLISTHEPTSRRYVKMDQ